MEVRAANKKRGIKPLLSAALIMLACMHLHAQFIHAKCEFRKGEFYIELDKNIRAAALDSFINAFNLEELNLKQVMHTNNLDTLRKLGWHILLNDPEKFILTRPLTGSMDIKDPVEAIINSEKIRSSLAERFPVVDERITYGYNRFKNKAAFFQDGSSVRFHLKNNLDADRVMLAGSFNDWSPEILPMKKTDSGWIAEVNLTPGKYWYKFVKDDKWMVDGDNLLKENDGLGNTNSVFFKSNVTFRLNAAQDAKKVFVAGSFNNWKRNELQMNRTANGWDLPIYLADGTHTYKFIADQQFLADPANAKKLPDGEGGYNSVLSLGEPHLFSLDGYKNAAHVQLTGSFNNWRKKELEMRKTVDGWELPYVLKPGNYEYRFIVDGKEILDPSNPLKATSPLNTVNSFLIIDPNYTFRLKMPGAKEVFLAGDFNSWSPNSLAMQKDGDEWFYSVHLSPGKHKYKFIVDGEWITDPGNKQWEQNEFGTGNSVIWMENVTKVRNE